MIDRRRLQQAMEAIVVERGRLTLFALMKRPESRDSWDLVVAAPWIDRGKLKAFSYIAAHLHERLGDQQMLRLSRIAQIPLRSEELSAILEEVRRENKPLPLELHGPNLFGLGVTDAVVFRAEPLKPRKAVNGSARTPKPRPRRRTSGREASR